MTAFTRFFAPLLISVTLLIQRTNGQSPTPIVVDAAVPAAPGSTTGTSVTAVSDSTTAAIKLLQEMKAANGETLQKQEAALQRLDEVQKAAEQIKIFATRG
jgi:hypothetical protein